MLINFGKFNGSTWQHVVDRDHQYMEWCLEKLDVAKFKIPDAALELYLEKFRNDARSTRLVDEWKRRLRIHLEKKAAYEAEQRAKDAEQPVAVQIMDTPMEAIPAYCVHVHAFEEACIEAFGCFPFTKRNVYASQT